MTKIKSKEELENFVFYETFALTLNRIKSNKEFRKATEILINYGLYGKIPDKIESNLTQILMEFAIPLIDSAKKRRKINTENGKKGGAPKGNKNAVKDGDIIEGNDIEKNNQSVEHKTTEKQPKNNLNININNNIKNNIKDNIKDNINEVDGNNIIESIIELTKNTITKCGGVYDSKGEQKFAKLLLTDNDINNRRQEHYKCTLFEFIVNTIKFSYASYNYANKVDSLFKLYYNYKTIYNTAISNPNENKNIKYTFYINHLYGNSKYDEKRKHIANFVSNSTPLPR